MDAVESRWHKDFSNVSGAVPQSWLVTLDGSTWIDSCHRNEPLIELYVNLLTIGYARGWLPGVYSHGD